MTADQRVTSAREYLAGIRQHKVTALPPSVLVRECAELRRQLGQVLDAIGQAEHGGPGEPGATTAAACGCPAGRGQIRHQRGVCTDPVVARLDWYADEPEIQGSRTASGTDPGGTTTIVPADLGTVLGALHDAAIWQGVPGGDQAAVAAYRSLGRQLGDDRG